MSLVTPSVQQISNNIVSQIEAALSQSIPLLPKTFARVLAKALAGVFVLVYKYAGFSFLQMFVRYASADPTEVNGVTIRPLVEWGRLIGIGDPIGATAGELLLSVPVITQTGSLAAGTQMTNRDNGVTYVTTASVLLNAPTVAVTVRAVSDQVGGQGLGAVGNLQPGATVSFANPLAAVGRDATVTSQSVTGADAEDVEVYRQRIIERFQAQPQGGAYADYRQWARGAAGILGVYPYASSSPGEVDVYVEATVASSGNADGIPTPAQLVAVYNLINLDENGLATRRPVTAAVNMYGITRTTFDVDIVGLVATNLAEVQADVEQGINELLRSAEPFIEGLSVLPRKDRITQTGVAGLVEAIVSAAGGTFQTLLLKIGGSPINAYTLGHGEKAKAGIVAYS